MSEVLREVSEGGAVRVTVRGRPVADLVPVDERPGRTFVPRARLEELLADHPPDPGFAEDIEDALSQTVDELR